MKKVQVEQQRKCQPKMKRKMSEPRSSNQEDSTCQAKRCSGIKLIFFCAAENLYPHLTAIIFFFCFFFILKFTRLNVKN